MCARCNAIVRVTLSRALDRTAPTVDCNFHPCLTDGGVSRAGPENREYQLRAQMKRGETCESFY
jgi:hypothetical protein